MRCRAWKKNKKPKKKKSQGAPTSTRHAPAGFLDSAQAKSPRRPFGEAIARERQGLVKPGCHGRRAREIRSTAKYPNVLAIHRAPAAITRACSRPLDRAHRRTRIFRPNLVAAEVIKLDAAALRHYAEDFSGSLQQPLHLLHPSAKACAVRPRSRGLALKPCLRDARAAGFAAE